MGGYWWQQLQEGWPVLINPGATALVSEGIGTSSAACLG